jgi:hypothetical protein
MSKKLGMHGFNYIHPIYVSLSDWATLDRFVLRLGLKVWLAECLKPIMKDLLFKFEEEERGEWGNKILNHHKMGINSGADMLRQKYRAVSSFFIVHTSFSLEKERTYFQYSILKRQRQNLSETVFF